MQKVEIVSRDTIKGLETVQSAKMFSIPSVMKKSFSLLRQELTTQSCDNKENTVVYTRYKNVDLKAMDCMGFFQKLLGMFDTMKMDIGISVKGFDYTKSDFQNGEIKAGNYVQYLHIGPYSKMYQAYDKLTKYVVENDIDIENETYDIYLNNPQEVPKEELETIVMVKIKS